MGHASPWEQVFYAEFDGNRKKRVIVKVIGEWCEDPTMARDTSDDRRCANCWFFHVGEVIDAAEVTDVETPGRCHRYPPLFVHKAKRPYRFPVLAASDWCGEWQPARKREE